MKETPHLEMGDSSYLNFSSPVGHLSGLDAKTITCKSTWLLFAGHRNPTVVSGTELRCRHLFSGLVVELERNLRGREDPSLPPQAPRRQNLKMNRVVLCPPPRVYTLYHPAAPEGMCWSFSSRRRKACLPGKSHPASGADCNLAGLVS